MMLRYQLCDFAIKAPCGKFFSQESMERILNSSEFKSRLASKDLMGTISHKLRWEEQAKAEDKSNKIPPLPQSDILISTGQAANCLENIWIEGTKLLCDLKVLSSTDFGKKILDLMENDKINPDVSMVVIEDDAQDKIEILDFFGVDFTFLPALNTKLLATFSKVNSYQNFLYKGDPEVSKVHLDCNSKFIGIIDEEIESGTEDESTASTECYSIREFIRVRDRKPMQALQLIINDIKGYVRSTKTEKLEKQKSLILEYLTSFLFSKITQILNDASTKMVNLNMILGLNRYCDVKSMQEFQRIANYILRQKKSLGYIDKRSQEMLAGATSKLILSMLDKIFDKFPEDKRNVFIPSPKSKSEGAIESKESENGKVDK